jgi:hypothetical protein
MPKPRKTIAPEPVQQELKVAVEEPVTEHIPAPVLKRERKVNPWLEHCKIVKQANEGMKYSEVLKLAKESYKKVEGV